jgi:hypothetical protein
LSAERLPHYIVPDLYSASHIINSKSNSLWLGVRPG